MYRPHYTVALRKGIAACYACNAEISNLDKALRVNQYVLRLNIAVNDTVLMRVLKCGQDTDSDLCRHLLRQASFFRYDLLQGTSAHVFHDKIAIAILFANIQQINNIMMAHLAGCQSLTMEALKEFFIIIKLWAQYFYSNIMTGALIGRPENKSHTALTDKFFQLIPLGKHMSDHFSASSTITLTLSPPPPCRARSIKACARSCIGQKRSTSAISSSVAISVSPSEQSSH